MNVLFVCTGNTCRSPMAEALMKKLAAEKGLDLVCDSAGVSAFPHMDMSKEAKEVLSQTFGIENVCHKSKQLTKQMMEEADLVVAMTENHRRLLLQAFLGENKTVTIPGEVGDPFGGTFSDYERAANEILTGLEKLLEEGKIHA